MNNTERNIDKKKFYFWKTYLISFLLLFSFFSAVVVTNSKKVDAFPVGYIVLGSFVLAFFTTHIIRYIKGNGKVKSNSEIEKIYALKSGEEYGGFYPRFFSALIDFILIIILFFVIEIYIISVGSRFVLAAIIIFVLSLYPIYCISNSVLVSIFSRSFGDLLFGLRIVDQGTGNKISFLRALTRSFYIGAFPLADWIYLGVDSEEKKQGPHDKLEKVIVIKSSVPRRVVITRYLIFPVFVIVIFLLVYVLFHIGSDIDVHL